LSFGNNHAALIKAARTIVVKYVKHTATMAAAVTREWRLELEQPNSPTLARARELSRRRAERYDDADKSSRHSICGALESALVLSSAGRHFYCNMKLLFQEAPGARTETHKRKRIAETDDACPAYSYIFCHDCIME